jgi:hypothetical protein
MSPISDDAFAALVAASTLQQKYAAVVDRESAYEMINARLDAARTAAANAAMQQANAAAQQAGAQQMSPTTNAGMNQMTPAQQRRELQRQAREAREAQKAIERQQRAAAAEAKRQRQAQERAERERQRTINSTIRAGEHIATSRLGQDIIRGVFGTLFGGGRK